MEKSTWSSVSLITQIVDNNAKLLSTSQAGVQDSSSAGCSIFYKLTDSEWSIWFKMGRHCALIGSVSKTKTLLPKEIHFFIFYLDFERYQGIPKLELMCLTNRMN